LPKDLPAARAAMGVLDFNPDHGDSEAAHWWMSEDESTPYSPERDALIPVGTVIPGIVAPRPRPPDQDPGVSCAARWAAGRWTLFATRRLKTERGDDTPIGSATYAWVAAFDHTVANHTRHIRPFKLEISP
jgi:hypothetical protein